MTETRRRRARRLFAVAALACAALPTAPALAAPDQQSLIEDEKLMLESGPAVQASSLDEAKALGADVIRANVIWSRYAPSPTSTKKPKGFDGKNPAAYAPGVFGMLDSFVAGAQARGMSVLLTADRADSRVGFGLQGLGQDALDVQAQRAALRRLRACARHALSDRQGVVDLERAEPPLVADAAVRGLRRPGGPALGLPVPLARDLGDRRPARHRPHDEDRPDLARRDRAARRRPVGLQRPAQAARAVALREVDHQDVARRRSCAASSASPPSGGSLRGTEGKDQHCPGYKKLAVNGYAHHPYTRGGSQPPLTRTNAGEITISVASRLTKLLDQAAKRKRVPSKLPINYTEHGWQTNPPGVHDAFAVTDAQQAEYINQSDWIAYQNARVHTVAQYKIVDDESIGAGFQMGLRLFSGGARKPSYDAYKLPIWVALKGSNVTVYGQARPADPGAAGNVEVQNATSAGGAFKTVATVPVTSANGTFTTTLPNSGGVWRLRWNGLTSRQAEAK